MMLYSRKSYFRIYFGQNIQLKGLFLSLLILIFEALAAPAVQKAAAKCAEAIRHCAPAGQTTDIYSYSSWR